MTASHRFGAAFSFFLGASLLSVGIPPAQASSPALPPRGAPFDYQLSQPYGLPPGVRVVVRDWFDGRPASRPHSYSICYLNAFQTQPDDPDVVRPDETSAWPTASVLSDLPHDPGWPGEYLIDLSTPDLRAAAVAHVTPMLQVCARKGFQAVDLDNLDAWTRFDGTPQEGLIPYGKPEAIDYARQLTQVAHGLGLASGQKNTPQLGRRVSRDVIRFDFAVAEECARYHECGRYRAAFGRHVLMIEYRDRDFRRACRSHGDAVSIVRRDRDLTAPGSSRYRYARCPSR